MNSLLQKLVCLCLTAGFLLALVPGQALADPVDFDFRQGPSQMIIPMDDFRQWHSHMTNTGDTADSYTLVATVDQPETWAFAVCYDGVCYPNSPSYTVPLSGTLAPGETVDFDFDVTSLFAEGAGHYTIEIVSNTDGSVVGTWEYDASTPTDGYAMLWSPGEGVAHVPVNEFYQFHPVLYNAGTMEDSYTLTAVRDEPENWSSTYCFDGVCYQPTETTQRVPELAGSTIAGGGAMPFEIDFTTLFDEGTGSITIRLTSNTDPAIWSTATFIATTGSVVGVDGLPQPLLSNLHAAPNPFNPKTDVRFNVGGTATQSALIDVFDASGRRVRTLVAGDLAPGPQSVSWDGRSDSGEIVSAGVYLARVHVGKAHQTVKMSLVK